MAKSQKLQWNDSNLTAKAFLAGVATASTTVNKRKN